MRSSPFTREEWTGALVSAAIHIALLLTAFLVKMDPPSLQPFAFIEVELGDFALGRATALADKTSDNARTARNPAPARQDRDVKNQTEAARQEETSRSAELSKQTQKIEDKDVIRTPQSENLDPRKDREQAKAEENAAAKDARKDEQDREGTEESGSEKGKTGDSGGDQGTGEDENLAAPYQLQWEGDIIRKPLSDLKPAFVGDMDAVITVRFQVRPDGSVGAMIPLKKMSPELEREIMRVLRTARFSPLPAGAPKLPQWGTITFRFVIE